MPNDSRSRTAVYEPGAERGRSWLIVPCFRRPELFPLRLAANAAGLHRRRGATVGEVCPALLARPSAESPVLGNVSERFRHRLLPRSCSAFKFLNDFFQCLHNPLAVLISVVIEVVPARVQIGTQSIRRVLAGDAFGFTFGHLLPPASSSNQEPNPTRPVPVPAVALPRALPRPHVPTAQTAAAMVLQFHGTGSIDSTKPAIHGHAASQTAGRLRPRNSLSASMRSAMLFDQGSVCPPRPLVPVP